MVEAYVNKTDLLVEVNAEIEFAKLSGNFHRATALAWVVAKIETSPFIEIKTKRDEPILYRHTGERE